MISGKEGCLGSEQVESADYCKLVNGQSFKVTSLLEVDFDSESVLESELGQKWCVKGMFMLKVVSSEKRLRF